MLSLGYVPGLPGRETEHSIPGREEGRQTPREVLKDTSVTGVGWGEIQQETRTLGESGRMPCGLVAARSFSKVLPNEMGSHREEF